MADVAQLVEPRIVIPVVAGSNPVIRPMFQKVSVVHSRSALLREHNRDTSGKISLGFFPCRSQPQSSFPELTIARLLEDRPPPA